MAVGEHVLKGGSFHTLSMFRREGRKKNDDVALTGEVWKAAEQKIAVNVGEFP